MFNSYWKTWGILGLLTLVFVLGFNYFSEKPSRKDTVQVWNNETTTAFRFKYPSNWIVKKTAISGGGEFLSIKTTAANPYFPRLDIESYPLIGSASAEQLSQPLEDAGYQKSATQVAGTTTTKMTKTFTGTAFNKTPIKNTQKEVLIFNRSANLIKISYVYPLNDPGILNIINQIISSLTFN